MSVTNQSIATFLRQIPQSNQQKATLQNTYPQSDDPSDLATLYGIAHMLMVFGIVTLDNKPSPADTLIQASSQTAKYALISLADFFERDATIITDWKTRGIQDDVLSNGATFLHALEQARLNRFDNSSPSRYVKAAQVLIKRLNPQTNIPELLFQFDANANQYQLIGGRWSEKDGDDLKITMIREIEEELPLNHLPHPQAYQLHCLADNLIIDGSISTTFGALTHYTFWVYHMSGLQYDLKLQDGDIWVPIQMVLDGVVQVAGKSYPFTSPQMYQRIDQSIDGGLMGLPISFQSPE